MAQTVQTEDLDITLIGLTPFTNYSIQIAAVNEEGDVGVYSEAEYVMTDEDSKPTEVHIMYHCLNYLSLSLSLSYTLSLPLSLFP